MDGPSEGFRHALLVSCIAILFLFVMVPFIFETIAALCYLASEFTVKRRGRDDVDLSGSD